MSWLRTSPLRQSLTRNPSNGSGSSSSFASGQNSALRQRPIDTATDCDPRACYDSFCKHWQQAYDIIQKSDGPNRPPTHDDVLAVVSHLDFMVTLLLVELHHCNKISLPDVSNTPAAPCLEYLLSENLLDKLYEWGCTTGRYANAVRLEQLKLYELLVSHSRHQLLCHEPFLRPLLKILASSQGEIFPPDLEKRLVILLNQLCVVLMQNVHLLDLFFFSSAQETQSKNNFIIFSLLIPYVHREGSLGHQARDALLLCMALSQKNSNIGTYIAQYSSMCPLLVTGLGGLYSRLPNSIEINSIDWHRITPDDVTEIPELTLFMNALEFCNAVVQVAHEMIKTQLLDFMYQGFIVPVLGPALLQTLKGKHFQTNVESQISAMSYLDLILRSVTEPALMKLFVKFLLDVEKFDGERILDTLVERLKSSDSNLCMVTMALFDTILGLHCEDLMLELLLKFLLPGKHVPISYRHKINRVDPYTNAADFFLELTPDVMKRVRELTKHKHLGDTAHHTHPTMPSPTSTLSKTIGANWNYYGLHTGDSLYANYHAYLFEAHFRIVQCSNACSVWSHDYRYQKWPRKSTKATNQTLEMVKQFLNEFDNNSADQSSNSNAPLMVYDDKKQLDSLQSIGESSGYESFKWRPADEEAPSEDIHYSSGAQHTTGQPFTMGGDMDLDTSNASGKLVIGGVATKRDFWRVSKNRNDLNLTDLDFSEDLFAQGTVSLGPFLNAIWAKLQTFTSNTLYVNLHLTGLITRLACYPLPLIHSILLRPDIVITSDTPSFHQVLRILKQQIDAELPVVEDSLEIIDVARSNLIDREFRLMNARKASENSPIHVAKTLQTPQSAYAHLSATSPVQVTPSSSYDPFKRNDNKRKSISKSFTSMFSRKTNATSGLSQIYAFFTGGLSGANGTTSTNGNQTQNPTQTNNAAVTRETSLTTLPPTPSVKVSSSGVTTTNSSTSSRERSIERGSSISSTSTLQSNSSATPYHHNTPLQHNLSVTTLSSLSERVGASSNMLGGSLLSGSGVGGGQGSGPASLDSLGGIGGGTERTRDLALCAVLLDEWLKELAAIAQEQSVIMINVGY
ncbi:FHIP family protein GG24907 isoform X1 [Stomoxys calcitrans]|uniref:FHIP family protein GG24907 isoform X1 n=1 Tax=Stomoxys calcitrans TaxID=35570 RepID=UPI0027E2C649|nr:FHIP family protein GG24907 isoform X1 [Stomoxys calcitrans]XP_013119047.2 FHIP family protein GG24907 isoform X1 [Stomoxys calcitrans]XP_013119049.2 FHIP family protein GG24907 isoform X1 [Stomoxys calcitrans]